MHADRITIYEVAERAGVSISTVSNAVNKPDRVSAETRRRVLAAADELGFVPKVAAADLARKGTGRIGVMAPFTSYASYLRRLSGVLEPRPARPAWRWWSTTTSRPPPRRHRRWRACRSTGAWTG